MLTEHADISGGYVDIYESSGAPTRTRNLEEQLKSIPAGRFT